MTLPSKIVDDTSLANGESRALSLLVPGPGPIRMSSTPSPHPVRSETGSLGILALYRPGDGQPVAHVVAPLSAGTIQLAYNATEADASLSGSWNCRVTNLADDTASWHTEITVGVPTILTASFDLALLNGILQTVVAASGICVHLESDSEQQKSTVVRWSEAIRQVMNTDHVAFHLDDPGGSVPNPLVPPPGPPINLNWRVKLDSIPDSATLILFGDPLTFSVSMSFYPARLQGLGTPDIELQPLPPTGEAGLQLGAEVGFDGTITPTCSVHAVADNIDVSGLVGDQFKSNIASLAGQKLPSDVLRAGLGSFFGRLLRLEPDGQIQGYRSDGTTLFVDHLGFPAEPPVGLPVTGQQTTGVVHVLPDHSVLPA